MKLRKIHSDKLNDNALSQLKTSLFEFKDENLELRLEDDEPVTAGNDYGESRSDLSSTSYNEIHGRWLLVNGNKMKKDTANAQSKNSDCMLEEYIII